MNTCKISHIATEENRGTYIRSWRATTKTMRCANLQILPLASRFKAFLSAASASGSKARSAQTESVLLTQILWQLTLRNFNVAGYI